MSGNYVASWSRGHGKQTHAWTTFRKKGTRDWWQWTVTDGYVTMFTITNTPFLWADKEVMRLWSWTVVTFNWRSVFDITRGFARNTATVVPGKELRRFGGWFCRYGDCVLVDEATTSFVQSSHETGVVVERAFHECVELLVHFQYGLYVQGWILPARSTKWVVRAIKRDGFVINHQVFVALQVVVNFPALLFLEITKPHTTSTLKSKNFPVSNFANAIHH